MGDYGDNLGAPEIEVTVTDGCVDTVAVARGGPCGATWNAARKIIGMPVAASAVRFGLEVQFFCSVNPPGWEPITGKSPVHMAVDIHQGIIVLIESMAGTGEKCRNGHIVITISLSL